MDAKLGVARVSYPEDVHIRETHQQVAHARSIGFHRVSGLLALGTVRLAESLCHARDGGPRSDPEEPLIAALKDALSKVPAR